MAQRTCSVDGCEEPHSGRGYCAVHYQHWQRWGDPLYWAPPRETQCSFLGCEGKRDSHGYCSAHAKQLARGMEPHPLRSFNPGAICSIPECGKPVVARGWCSKHWRRWKAYGNPLHREPPSRRGARRYTLDESYFDEICTEEQAYWLGFITADGGVIRSGRTFTLRVELAKRDGGHVGRLAQALNSNRPLVTRRGCVIGSFDSWQMVAALGNLGITPRKSATVHPWQGPAPLMRHYWRGLFDGDGSICHGRTTGNWMLSICGSEACVRGFAEWGSSVCHSAARPRIVRGECWSWAVGGNRKAWQLALALYDGASIALPRKSKLASQLLRGEPRA